MNRADFGSFGAGLSDDEFAQALAFLASAMSMQISIPDLRQNRKELNYRRPYERFFRAMGEGNEFHVTVAPNDIIEIARFSDAKHFGDWWQAWLASRWIEGGSPFRIRIPASEHDESDGPDWLMQQLCRQSVGASSVYFGGEHRSKDINWQWPIRFGVLASRIRPSASSLIKGALGCTAFPELWREINVARPGAECELLLLSGDIREALADVLLAPHRVQADCVLVLDSSGNPPASTRALARSLRQEARTAGVALIAISKGGEDKFLTELIRELSHDFALDVAIFNVVARLTLKPPQLFFSRTLIQNTKASLTAERIARQFSNEKQIITTRSTSPESGRRSARSGTFSRSNDNAGDAGDEVRFRTTGGPSPELKVGQLPDPVVAAISKEIGDLAKLGRWERESQEATTLVRRRADIESNIKQTMRVPKVGDFVPPQPVADIDSRRVQFQVREITPGAINVASFLEANDTYEIALAIADFLPEFYQSDAAFPDSGLPKNSTGHVLQVSFVPLSLNKHGKQDLPKQASLFLPPLGNSGEVKFEFNTHTDALSYRARVIISFEGRILQTLIFEGGISTSWTGPSIGISVENLVHPGFANLAYLQPFDAAIVINHSLRNLAGITTMSEGKLTFSERPGLDALQKNLQAVLSNETTLTETHGDLESESMANLLFELANHGRMLFDAIENEIGSLDRDAGRIQVVEARAGAFFPIEFIYPIPVPQERPPMCPHAKAALEDPDIHHVCANHNDENFMCPMRFWGFRKIIERQPPSNSSTETGEVRVPSPFNAKLDLFRCAQVAKSAKVRPEDYDLPDGVLNVLAPAFISVQSDFVKWKKWKDTVKLESPTFLLLLSHSAKGVAGLPALEIGGDLLGIASIESAYVKGPHTDSPVLFILGCSTADPNLGFLNYVERFKKKNAALVVGTLSMISGKRATMFLKLAIPILKAASGSGKTFGEVFLELKRSMLANGDGFVMSLVAYGEIDWQL